MWYKKISLKVVQPTLDCENNKNRTLPRAKESKDATLSSLSSSTARIAISTGINGKKTQTTGVLERFSFECRKVIGFAFARLRDWLKKLVPLFHPIMSKTKANRDSLVRVFPRFASATCNYFVFWLVKLIIRVLCDWLEWLLGFWFHDTQLKTALNTDDTY